MTKVYKGLGVEFSYPDQWKLDLSEEKTVKSVSVLGPGGSFWSIARRPRDTNLSRMVQEVVETMKSLYEDLDAEPTSETIQDVQLIGYDLNFIYLDLTNTARVRAFSTRQGTYLIMCQAEDRDWPHVEEAFYLLSASALKSQLERVD